MAEESTNFAVFDHFPDGFYAIAQDWKYIYVNKQGVKLAQMPRHRLLGKSPQELFPDAHDSAFGQTVKLVMKDRQPRSIKAYYPRYKKWYENTVFPIPEGVGILGRDITAQMKAEGDQFLLASIVTFSDDAIVSKDLSGIIMSWNTGAEKMFGYRAEEIVGKSIRTIIPKELQKEEDFILVKLKKGEPIKHYQTIRIAKDGRRLAVSLTISPVRNALGEIIGVSKIIHDITSIKQTENNLTFLAAASKELSTSLDYEKTLNNVVSLAVPHIADWCSVEMLDPTGKLELVAVAHKDPNKTKWARQLRKKFPPDMNAKTGLPNVLRTGKSELYPFIDEKMIEQSTTNKRQVDLIRKLQLTSVIMTPIFYHGKPIGGISFISGESKRRYSSVDLAMAEELASRASFAIENAKLYQVMQQELAERKKLEKQKDEFIGVASHELKTPVTSIKSFAQLLHYKFQREGHPQAAELLGKLDNQIDKLTSLIGDLLDITKIHAGRMLFNQSEFAFDELVAEIIEEMQRTTEKHSLVMKGKTKQKIVGDRERIGQVLTNLISNAIKYSPKTKKIIVSSSVKQKHVKLSVQDFGIGIARDKLDKVFEQFFRVSGPGQETYPGLGLGLYISSEIIKRLDGKIWVESIEGKGSTFCFMLPIKQKKKGKESA